MKMEFWLLILVLCHATNSIESVNSPQNIMKLYKTFDEIFGKGWENEEKPKLLESNESQRMETSSTDNRHENSDHTIQGRGRLNGPEESLAQKDRPQIDQNDNIQSNQVPVELVDSNPLHDLENEKACSEGHKKVKVKCYSDDKKRKIVQEYIALKDKFAQQKKHSQNEWNQFNANVSKELDVSHGTIFKWKKQFFGLDKIWHSECYSDERKREIVQEYIALKNKFMQEKKHSENEWKQFRANITKELGVSHGTVYRWKKQFGLDKIWHSDEQRQEKLKEYYEIKLRNPTIKDTDITAALKISIATLTRWKSQFKHVPELNVPKSNGPPPV